MVDDYLPYGKLLKYYHKKVGSFSIVREKIYSLKKVNKSLTQIMLLVANLANSKSLKFHVVKYSE